MKKIEILNFQNILITNAKVITNPLSQTHTREEKTVSIVIVRDPYDYFNYLLFDLLENKKSILFTEDIKNSIETLSDDDFLKWFKELNFIPFYNPQTFHLDMQKRLPKAIKNLESFDYVVPFEEIDTFLENVSLEIEIDIQKEKELPFSLNSGQELSKEFIDKDLRLYGIVWDLWDKTKENDFQPLHAHKKHEKTKIETTKNTIQPSPSQQKNKKVNKNEKIAKKRLFLHIGTEKTGTTSIQQTLFRNYDKFKAKDILYPRSLMTGSNHAGFTASFLGEEAISTVAQNLGDTGALLLKNHHYLLDRLEEEIVESGCSTVIISSELLHSRVKYEDTVEDIKRWAEERFDEIYVICYLRKQIDLVVSGYSTRIKEGDTPHGSLSGVFSDLIDQFASSKEIPHYFDYKKMLDMWSKCFPHMICREFSRSTLKDGDVVEDFLSLIDPQMDNSQLETGEERIPAIVDGKPNPKRRHLVAFFENIPPKTKMLPHEEDAVNLQNYFKEDNQYISDKYFNGKALFQDEIKFKKEYHDGLSTDKSIEIFAKIWGQASEYMNRLEARDKYFQAEIAYQSNKHHLARSLLQQSFKTGIKLPKATKLLKKLQKDKDLTVETAKKNVQPLPSVQKYKGIAGQITSTSINGWAFNKEDEEPVNIEIYKNGNFLRKVKADMLREDLVKRKIHPTGKCGFKVKFDQLTFTKGDKIEIKIVPDNFRLRIGEDIKKFLGGESISRKEIPERVTEKRVILHIGSSKTGSSALQSFCLDHQAVLEEAGYYYPSHYTDANKMSSGNGLKMLAFANKSGIEAAKKEIDKIISNSPQKNIIISTEYFYPYPEMVHKLFPEATIIVYFREPTARLESAYNQTIKKAYRTQPFLKVLQDTLNSEEDAIYSGEILKKWMDLYGKENIILRPYEEEQFKGGSIFSDFITSIGITWSEKFKLPKEHVNVSYTRDASEFKLLLNRIIVQKDENVEKMIDLALQAYSQKAAARGEQKYPLLSKEEREKLLAHYEPTNCFIAKELLNRKDGKLFYALDNASKLSPYPGLTAEHIQELANYIAAEYPEAVTYIRNNIRNGSKSEKTEVKNAALELTPSLVILEKYKA